MHTAVSNSLSDFAESVLANGYILAEYCSLILHSLTWRSAGTFFDVRVSWLRLAESELPRLQFISQYFHKQSNFLVCVPLSMPRILCFNLLRQCLLFCTAESWKICGLCLIYCIWIKGSITYIQKIGRMIRFGVFMYWSLSSLYPGHETQPPLVILTRKITSTKKLPNARCALYLGTSKVHENYMESRGTHYNRERIIFKKLRCKLVCQPCLTQCVILFTPWLVISSG